MGHATEMLIFSNYLPNQIQYSRESGLENESPKHGKIDQNNDPHVGKDSFKSTIFLVI